MRVLYVSTYPPIECGIATYTENIVKSMLKFRKEVLVVSQTGAKGNKVFEAFNPNEYSIAMDIYKIIAKLTPDVVHIQHEFGLYGDQKGVQIIELILRLKIAGLPVVTTLHTVMEKMERADEIILKNIVTESSIVIVHEKYQKNILEKKYGKNNKIKIIPHGIRDVKPIPNAKKTLNLENEKVILMCGYFRKTKNFDKIVDIFPKLVEKHSDVTLLIAGKLRDVEFSEYQHNFFEKINTSPAKDKILVLRGQFPQYTFDTFISAADVLVLPYKMGAQSGILSNAASFDLPVVTSTLQSFRIWNKISKGGLTAKNDQDYIDHIEKILYEPGFSEKLKENIRKFKQDLLWENIIQKHLIVYEEVITVPYGNARYFYNPEPK